MSVIGVASALGTIGVKIGERVIEHFQPPAPALPPQLQLVEPLSWLPAGLLTSDAPHVSITSNTTGQAAIFGQLQYLGHTLYYQASQRLLIWRAAPGIMRQLSGPQDVALVAEQLPYGPSRADLGPTHALAPGRVPHSAEQVTAERETCAVLSIATSRPGFPGTGVGLCPVKRPVENASGRLPGESQLGVSSTFRVAWPT